MESGALIKSAEYLSRIGLRSKDALHIACAIDAGCDIFFTTDDGILKKAARISEVRVLNPVDYFTGERT